MGNNIGLARGVLSLALVLSLLGMSACVATDAKGQPFDIPAQSAATALNEFAKQADVTLIFSYDLVAGEHTGPLKGRFSVGDGLTRLLDGTPLGYRQAVNGTYFICPRVSCGLAPSAESERSDSAGHEGNARRDGGNPARPRLQDKPVTVPGT